MLLSVTEKKNPKKIALFKCKFSYTLRKGRRGDEGRESQRRKDCWRKAGRRGGSSGGSMGTKELPLCRFSAIE